MQVTKTDLSETKVKLTVAVTAAELADVKQNTIQKLGKNVKAPGFRPGKAPLSVIEQQLGENYIQAETMQAVLNKFYSLAVADQKLRTLNSPEADVTKFVAYSELEFTAEVEVMPKIKLGDYKKIKKSAPKTTVSDKEVTNVVDNLRERVAKKEESKAAAKDGDEVIVDFVGKDVKGEPVAGASGTDYPLTLGSKTFIPGFEEGLIGVKAGDKKTLKLTFPKDYHAKNLAGSKINFDVTVKKVNAVVMPKADDNFASTVGPFKTLADLKKDIKSQLAEQKQNEAENKLKDEIVEELVKKSKLVLPEILVTDQIAMLEHDFRQNLTYRGITLNEYLEQEGYKDEADWKDKELKPQAERRVSVGMVLAEVAEQEDVQVTQEEVAARIALHKQQYQQSADQFDSPEMQREVASRVLTEKTVDLLYSMATKS